LRRFLCRSGDGSFQHPAARIRKQLVAVRLVRDAFVAGVLALRLPPSGGQNALLTKHDLEEIAGLTLQHYNRNAEDFREGTRDLKAFAALGHIAVGLEGASRLAAMARADTGCEVWEQDFLKLDLPERRFDGIFANAALFHVPSQALARVLLQLHATLKPRGVLFASNPHGHNE
jgi:SAM-dependent methyltransferase